MYNRHEESFMSVTRSLMQFKYSIDRDKKITISANFRKIETAEYRS